MQFFRHVKLSSTEAIGRALNESGVPFDPMPDGAIDWSLTTFDGLRAAQQREFAALSFREKLIRLEQMAEIADRVRPGGQ